MQLSPELQTSEITRTPGTSDRYGDSVTKAGKDSPHLHQENEKGSGWGWGDTYGGCECILMENSKGVMVSLYKLSDCGLGDHAIIKMEMVQHLPEWMLLQI